LINKEPTLGLSSHWPFFLCVSHSPSRVTSQVVKLAFSQKF